MDNLISVISEKCTGCGACMRSCPAPEANIYRILEDGRKVVEVNDKMCIACGKCVKACPHNARDFEDDLEKLFKDMRNKRIVLLVSPAIRTSFPDTWQQILKWFREEGIYKVFDLSLGADICAWANMRAIEQGKINSAVSSQCPAVVNYINKYVPEMANDVSPVYSPAACMSVYIRTYLKINYSVAVFSPCIATRTDLGENNTLIDYNITFQRLEEHLTRKKIRFQKSSESTSTFNFDDEQGLLGCLSVRPGGLRDNMWIREPELNISAAAGTENGYESVRLFGDSPDHIHPKLLDVLSCDCGCVRGPACDSEVTSFQIDSIMHEMELDARSRRKTGIMNGPDKQFKHFDDIFNLKSFMRSFDGNDKPREKISASDLDPIFAKLCMKSESERKFNCGFCGNKTCREMAESIYNGCNVPENCIKVLRVTGGNSGSDFENAKRLAEVSGLAEKVGNFATNLLADIENIYASLYNIDEANRLSQNRASVVNDILSKIIGFCNSTEYIDETNLPVLVSTLEKLQSSLDALNTMIDSSATNSTTIRDAMQQVADATTELNVMVHEMLDTADNKY